MRKETIPLFTIVYLVILAINIFSQMWVMPVGVLPVSKTLLMPVLMLCFVAAIHRPFPVIAYIILSALFFSWAGDVLLLFQKNSPEFFIAGLVSFLCAHLAYISFFVKIKNPSPGWWKKNAIVIFMVLVYGLLLLALLWKHLGSMQIPVLIYTICIIMMLLTCIRTLPELPKAIWIWLGIGAWLFVMSDSILAINKFMQPFQFAGPFIMLTYGLAQLFIVIGCIRFFRAKFGATAVPAE